jgi:hypothetical protein
MMPVGDVQRRHGVEERGDARDAVRVADRPDGVAGAVVECRSGVGRPTHGVREERVDLGRARVRHEHRPGLRVERLHVPHAVVFLVRARMLVLADAVRFVRRDRRRSHQSRLRVIARGNAIDVVRGRRVAYEHARVEHPREVLGGLRVDRRRVRIDTRRQVDLGLRDVQEAPRAARRARARLVRGDHVVGRRDDVGGAAGRGAQGRKRTNEGQGSSGRTRSEPRFYRAPARA